MMIFPINGSDLQMMSLSWMQVINPPPPQASNDPPPCETFSAPGRSPKAKFTRNEDLRLCELVETIGMTNWPKIASLMPDRNARQCRERYRNYLDPDLRWDRWTPEEDKLLIAKFRDLGPRWNTIGQFFVNRSDNALRNRWQQLSRRKMKIGSTSKRMKRIATKRPAPATDVMVSGNKPGITNSLDLVDSQNPVFDPFEHWNPFKC
jgi:hypothetical protein